MSGLCFNVEAVLQFLGTRDQFILMKMLWGIHMPRPTRLAATPWTDSGMIDRYIWIPASELGSHVGPTRLASIPRIGRRAGSSLCFLKQTVKKPVHLSFLVMNLLLLMQPRPMGIHIFTQSRAGILESFREYAFHGCTTHKTYTLYTRIGNTKQTGNTPHCSKNKDRPCLQSH